MSRRHRQRHEHADLIDGLGGSKMLFKKLGKVSEEMVTEGAIRQWYARGISAKYRPLVAIVAKDSGVALPDGFFGQKPHRTVKVIAR